MESITYSLRAGENNSNRFYNILDEFSSEVYNHLKREWSEVIYNYKSALDSSEEARSEGEYIVELLTLYSVWERYQSASESSLKPFLDFLYRLFKLRFRGGFYKKVSDYIRGILIGLFLVPNITKGLTSSNFSIKNLKKLLLWLKATGEFHNEVKRFNIWSDFLESRESGDISDFFSTIKKGYLWFKGEARKRIGRYTEGVNTFLDGEYKKYRFREDEIFCGKEEVEYHINMVASILISREFRERFDKTTNRVILVPGCMAKRGRDCRAERSGFDIKCFGCSSDCSINRIRLEAERRGSSLYIVPHTSGFSKWLERWKDTRETGVTAVGCALNIVPGGLEMRSKNIPSQCLILDNCGCKKHWHREGISTELNMDRLFNSSPI